MLSEDKNNLQAELDSLGIECKRTNEFNDKEELQALATAVILNSTPSSSS
jgi:hypothetical protein